MKWLDYVTKMMQFLQKILYIFIYNINKRKNIFAYCTQIKHLQAFISNIYCISFPIVIYIEKKNKFVVLREYKTAKTWTLSE